MYEAMTSQPPIVIRALNGLFTFIAVLALALIVFAQWTGWVLAGISIWNPWGCIVGIAISATQMLALFERGFRKNEACEIPRSSSAD